MMKLHDVFMIGGIFCSFVTSFLLFFKSNYHRHANRQLAIILFSLGWYAFIYLLWLGGWLIDVPYIFRTGSPLYYLIPPLSYLYIRSVLYDETSFRRTDWLHFIPALINFAELLPFYLADPEVKKRVVEVIAKDLNQSYQTGSGLIPALVHAVLRPVQGIIYLVFQWLLLLRFSAHKRPMRKPLLPENKKWLYVFSSFLTTIYVALAVITIIGLKYLGTGANILQKGKIAVFVIDFTFFAFSTYLFFKPTILYGMPVLHTSLAPERTETVTPSTQAGTALPDQEIAVIETSVSQESVNRKEISLNESLVRAYCQKLEEYITGRQAFRTQGLSLGQLSDALEIPRHHLSYLLNQHYHLRFSDFINHYRVQYIKERMAQQHWKEFTLEALAEEAGFSSRSTFFSAFKKETGVSPTEYLKQYNA